MINLDPPGAENKPSNEMSRVRAATKNGDATLPLLRIFKCPSEEWRGVILADRFGQPQKWTRLSVDE